MEKANPTAKPKGKQPNPPRKHHYVPVFYQQKFTNENGLLWVYDRQLHTYKELHPEVVCFQKDLYSIRPEDKPVDTRIETTVTSIVDGLAAMAIGKIERREGLDWKSFDAFTFFAGLQHQRIPVVERDTRLMYAKAIEEATRIMFANVERAKSAIDSYLKDGGKETTVTPESMVKAVQNKEFEIVATETAFLSTMLDMSEKLGKLLQQMESEILVAPSGTGFVICDAPFTLVPARGGHHIGFAVPGVVKYLPISRAMCFRAADVGRPMGYRNVDKETVRIINHNIAAHSERFIMGPDKKQIEAVVTRSASENAENIPRFVVETVQSDGDSSLQKMSSRPRRYFYPKNGSNLAP
jgi:hypothetical protein